MLGRSADPAVDRLGGMANPLVPNVGGNPLDRADTDGLDIVALAPFQLVHFDVSLPIGNDRASPLEPLQEARDLGGWMQPEEEVDMRLDRSKRQYAGTLLLSDR